MTIAVDLDALLGVIESRASTGRLVIAVAGAPGSGKSTLAEALTARLNAASPGSTALLPMDGYHYDDSVLIERGLRPRKGSPPTFDVGGLAHMLARLRSGGEDEIAVPVFDRALEIARAGARIIPASVSRIVVEGNYLLLAAPPWSGLHRHFDITVMLDVPEPVLRARLTARWEGFKLTPDEIVAKLEDNDLPNGRVVMSSSIAPDHVLRMEA